MLGCGEELPALNEQGVDVRGQPWNGLRRLRSVFRSCPDHDARTTARDPFTGTGGVDLVMATMETPEPASSAEGHHHLRDEPDEE